MREVQPLVELRVPFELTREELEAVGRGAADPDLTAVRQAARSAGLAEDRAVFHGYADGGITGIAQAAAAETLSIPSDYESYPGIVADAVNRLRSTGVNGPYGIALGPRCYTGLTKTTKGGYPVIEHVRRLLDGPDRVGARGQRRGGAVHARRRFRADRGTGLLHRLSRPQRHDRAAVPAGELHLPGAGARGRHPARVQDGLSLAFSPLREHGVHRPAA